MPTDISGEPTFGSTQSSDGSNVGERAKDTAREAQKAAQQKAEQFAGERKKVIASEIHGFASALQAAASDLDRQGKESTAGYTRQAADLVNRVGDTLDRNSLGDMIHRLEQVGRDQPVLLAGGAALLGFIASRFMRTGVEERFASGDESYGDEDFDYDEALEIDEDIEVDDELVTASEVPVYPSGSAAGSVTSRGVPPDEPAGGAWTQAGSTEPSDIASQGESYDERH